MKNLIFVFVSSLIISPVFAVETTPGQTTDPKKAEELVKTQQEQKQPIAERREALKKKHKEKKAKKAMAAEQAAATPSPTTTVAPTALPNANSGLVNDVKVETKTEEQRDDNKAHTH